MTTWVRVARIGKPFGVAGRVTVQVFTEAPEQRFVTGTLLACDDTGADPQTLTWVGRSGARWLLAFEGVTDRDAAERLRDRELYADAGSPELGDDPGEWFDWQLVGLPCRLADGTPVGTVTGVEHPPAHDLLVVALPGGGVARVPFVAQIAVSVGPDGIVLDPPAGLLDLSQPGDEP